MVYKSGFLVVLFLSTCSSDTGFRDTVQVTEADGSPKCMAGQLKFSNGTVTCSGQTATVVNSGGGGGGSATLPLPGGATNYIQNTSSLQSGSTFYVSSGTVNGQTYLAATSGSVVIGTTSLKTDMLTLNNGVIKILGPTPANYFDIGVANDLVTIQFFESGVKDHLLTIGTGGSASQGFTYNGFGRFSNTITVGGLINTAALYSAPSGTSFSNTDAGILELWGDTGKDSFINFNEKGVANRGSFGFPSGTGDIVYRSGATTLSDGTERFRITSVGNVRVVTGHLNSGGSSPSLSSCGTSPSIVGSDNAGTITVGSGVTLSCTITFAAAWTNAPTCVMTINTTGVTGGITALSTTAATFSFSATVGGGQIYYVCHGRD